MPISHDQQHLLLELANLERGLAVATQPTDPAQDLLAERERVLKGAAAAQRALSDIENDIARIQADERKLRARERDDIHQLSAEIDLEHRKDLQHDLYAVKSRIEDLMYELKECHNELAPLRQNVDLYDEKLKRLDARIDEARSQEVKEEDPANRIAQLKAQLPEDVVAEYERRRQENGVGVAFFNGRSCSGCAVQLSSAERAEVNQTADDELAECPNCGSGLVR